MRHFAILRHGKIKSGRHLVSAGLHNGRGAATPNADPEAPPVEVLVGSAKPHRDVMSELQRRGVDKVRKRGNVAVEIVLAASPEWWEAKGWKPGCRPEGELLALLEEWKAAQLEYLRDRCGDRLVSAIYHGDEASPHIQALTVPVIWRKDGREKGELAGREAWRLDAEVEMGSPGVLKARQTDYANRMARFGLVRGKDIETEEREARGETHKPARVWQQEEGQKDRQRDALLAQLIAAREQADQEREQARQALSEALRTEEAGKARLAEVEQREAALRASERAALLATGKTEAVRRHQAAERVEIAAMKFDLAKEMTAVAGLREQLQRTIDQLEAQFLALIEPVIRRVKDYQDKRPTLSTIQRQAGDVIAARAKAVIEGPDVVAIKALLDRGRGLSK